MYLARTTFPRVIISSHSLLLHVISGTVNLPSASYLLRYTCSCLTLSSLSPECKSLVKVKVVQRGVVGISSTVDVGEIIGGSGGTGTSGVVVVFWDTRGILSEFFVVGDTTIGMVLPDDPLVSSDLLVIVTVRVTGVAAFPDASETV